MWKERDAVIPYLDYVQFPACEIESRREGDDEQKKNEVNDFL